MILHAILFCAIFAPAVVYARPQQQQTAVSSDAVTPIPIINHSEIIGEDGNFNYSYETGNGIRFDQSGYTKIVPNLANRIGAEGEENPNGVVQVLSGSYSYAAPDGTLINLSYIADENGFQPVGDHLPTPPPIPESIQRVLDMLPKLQETAAASQTSNVVIAETDPQE